MDSNAKMKVTAQEKELSRARLLGSHGVTTRVLIGFVFCILALLLVARLLALESIASYVTAHSLLATRLRSGSGGISFRRTIETYSHLSQMIVQFSGENDGKVHCHSSDVFGDNSCHYDWNDHLVMNYSILVDEALTEEAYVTGVFQIDAKLPWTFTCALCGTDCVWKMPFVDFNYTWNLPPCPLESKNRSHSLDIHLWRESPLNGWMVLPFRGILNVYSRPNTLLANMTVLVTVK